MPWLQLEMPIGGLDAERVEAALNDAGALSITLDDGGDTPIYQEDVALPPLWNNTRVSCLFPADADIDSLRACLQSALGIRQLPPHQFQMLEDREWTREWLKDFRPKRFGQRLWICPTTHPPPDPEAINIQLDPGLAFGTGTHATTALCLEWLEANNLADQTLIDYGCGSGILAIAALRLGARQVWAVDIDPQALTAAHENAGRNQVLNRLNIAPPEELGSQQVDVLVANILVGPLLELAPHFAGLVRTGGTLLLSGILDSQEQAIRSAYAHWFQFHEISRREEWLLMAGSRWKDR